MSINASPTLGALLTSLSLAQGELSDASKSSSNPHFKSKYADLAEILQTIRPVLSKNGLSVSQFIGAYDANTRNVSITTILGHKSGEFLESTLTMPVAKADPQGIGSATTYARRYALAAVTGIAQDDDDGNAASGSGGAQKAAKQTKPKAQKMDAEELKAAFESAKTPAELDALADAFAALPPGDQTAILPLAIEARKRVGQ